MEDRYIYGVDFGTSNSCLAILDVERNAIVKTFMEASVLYFPETEPKNHLCHTGRAAIGQYVQGGMRGRFMKSLKSVLPHTTFTETEVYGVRYTLEELVAVIIGNLKRQADAFLGQNVTEAVFGRPVIFDGNPAKDKIAQQRIRNAARLSGFGRINFQYEPVAAAFAYERALQKPELVLVADIGGGTSDFTLMQLDPSKTDSTNRGADILGKDGIHIGGDDFDAGIMWREIVPYFGYGLQYQSQEGKMLDLPLQYFRNICSWEKMNFFKSRKIKNDIEYYQFATGNHPALARLWTLVDENLGFALFRAIERAKMDLSEMPQTKIAYQHGNIHIDQALSAERFGQILHKDLLAIKRQLMLFLRQLNRPPADIGSVFMTGGSSQVPAIRQIFGQMFPHATIHAGDNFNSVVHGLAYGWRLFA